MLTETSTSHDGQQYRLEPDDDGLRIAALKLLQSSGYTALRRLRCEVTDAVVIVHGVLPSYFLKQMAQTIIQRLEGIQSVMNLVEVREPASSPCCENEHETSEVEFAVET
jgi:hypothetical protein